MPRTMTVTAPVVQTSDYTTMNGFLFFSCLNCALGSFSMMPVVFAQKEVYYKQADALFLPTAAFTLSQASGRRAVLGLLQGSQPQLAVVGAP
jgi:hypothetical protein